MFEKFRLIFMCFFGLLVGWVLVLLTESKGFVMKKLSVVAGLFALTMGAQVLAAPVEMTSAEMKRVVAGEVTVTEQFVNNKNGTFSHIVTTTDTKLGGANNAGGNGKNNANDNAFKEVTETTTVETIYRGHFRAGNVINVVSY